MNYEEIEFQELANLHCKVFANKSYKEAENISLDLFINLKRAVYSYNCLSSFKHFDGYDKSFEAQTELYSKVDITFIYLVKSIDFLESFIVKVANLLNPHTFDKPDIEKYKKDYCEAIQPLTSIHELESFKFRTGFTDKKCNLKQSFDYLNLMKPVVYPSNLDYQLWGYITKIKQVRNLIHKESINYVFDVCMGLRLPFYFEKEKDGYIDIKTLNVNHKLFKIGSEKPVDSELIQYTSKISDLTIYFKHVYEFYIASLKALDKVDK